MTFRWRFCSTRGALADADISERKPRWSAQTDLREGPLRRAFGFSRTSVRRHRRFELDRLNTQQPTPLRLIEQTSLQRPLGLLPSEEEIDCFGGPLARRARRASWSSLYAAPAATAEVYEPSCRRASDIGARDPDGQDVAERRRRCGRRGKHGLGVRSKNRLPRQLKRKRPSACRTRPVLGWAARRSCLACVGGAKPPLQETFEVPDEAGRAGIGGECCFPHSRSVYRLTRQCLDTSSGEQ